MKLNQVELNTLIILVNHEVEYYENMYEEEKRNGNKGEMQIINKDLKELKTLKGKLESEVK